MILSKKDIDLLSHQFKINLINSISGIKPANLIGTSDLQGNQNLAIFSSVFHLGSKPALLGFVTRPSQKRVRHTLSNILETRSYTINHIPPHLTQNAHLTSAKYDKSISEFDVCHFTPELKENSIAPFVQESTIQIGMKYVDTIPVLYNQTKIIIGEITSITIKDDKLIDKKGNLNLSKSSGVSGLHTYYSFNKEDEYPQVIVTKELSK